MLRIFKITVGTLVAFIIIFVLAAKLKSMGTRESGYDRAKMHYLTIKGSDTMVHLTSEWAETFMNDYPEINVSVTGGGSGTGIAALINGTTDICIASREIKENERMQAEQKGITPVEVPVAEDAIVVIVNPDNPVSELTMEQMKEIFSGAVSNWNQIGGPDRPIFVLSRESSSGTYVFFQERVLSKADYTYRARLMPGTSAVVQNVSADIWSVGYVGLGYALEAINHIKIILVKIDEKSPPVIPSEESVKKAEYPIARLLYFYINGNPQGLVKKFIEFCLSNKGQKIVTETGYVKIN
jgi:phosphate transport system substrate-binding protein